MRSGPSSFEDQMVTSEGTLTSNLITLYKALGGGLLCLDIGFLKSGHVPGVRRRAHYSGIDSYPDIVRFQRESLMYGLLLLLAMALACFLSRSECLVTNPLNSLIRSPWPFINRSMDSAQQIGGQPLKRIRSKQAIVPVIFCVWLWVNRCMAFFTLWRSGIHHMRG